jgi:CubicO group peptidase (beta-lactamase class C family)
MTRRPMGPSRTAFLLLAAALGLPSLAQQLPPPTFPAASWEQRAPSELGMNAAKLEEAKAYSLTRNGAGLIARNGYQVASWGKTTDRYPLFSVTKAVGALLLGHATKAHGITLADKAQTHYPDFGNLPVENQATGFLDDVTIEQLATHSAGFEKTSGAPRLKFQPGTQWVYSDGGANWLADTLTFKYNEDLRSVLKREFLDHLGITLRIPVTAPAGMIEWRDVSATNPRGTTIGATPRREFNAGISASVDAMARLGLLVERKGQWNGVEIVPSAFVEQMVKPAASLAGLPITDTGGAPDPHYPNATAHHGLFWWNNADGAMPNVPTDTHWAWGLGDHLIVVIPSLGIVAARTSGQAAEGDGRLQPNPWKNTDPNCVSEMCAHYDALDPFLTPIVQSVDGSGPTPPPPPAGAPTVTLTADPATVTTGATSVLNWSSTNADSCTASGGWTGTKAVSGTETVTVSQTTTYTLACTGAGGTTQASATVTANAPAPPPPPPAPEPPPADDGGGGGGAVQWWMLLALAALSALRRVFVAGRRREPALA